jgi:hypothetical protein
MSAHAMERNAGFLHSLMSGKYAQNRLIGSRTVVLFSVSFGAQIPNTNLTGKDHPALLLSLHPSPRLPVCNFY